MPAFAAWLDTFSVAAACAGFLAVLACLEVFAVAADVAAKVLTGVANAAMASETATDRAVLRAAPWSTFSDENMSVFMGVR
ncbi:hypothetical protein HDG38_002222 [Paraburkholderia sp. WSM4177]|nr:hypothetical protein [Paraburkholderia sp. WSM4177]MBB5484168.1 hypothetical protein [Paraburkholderia sp. WSM4180]